MQGRQATASGSLRHRWPRGPRGMGLLTEFVAEGDLCIITEPLVFECPRLNIITSGCQQKKCTSQLQQR